VRIRLWSILAIGGLLLMLLVPSAKQGVSAASGLTQTFTGSGTQTTASFNLQAGLVVFHNRYNGSDNFIAWMYDSLGNRIALAANDIGTSTSSTRAQVPRGGAFILSVESSGTWTIVVMNPGNALDGPVPIPTTLYGEGRAVSAPVTLKRGLLVVFFSYIGPDNFIAELHDATGGFVGLGANEIGSATGSRAIQIPSDGEYLFGVLSSGTWSLGLSPNTSPPPPPAPVV
jgi:hypothetical protein